MKLLPLVMLVLLAPVAHAASCGKAGGAKIFNQEAGGGYVMHLYLAERDLQLVFPGETLVQDKPAPDPAFEFSVDGILYQVLATPVAPLPDGEARPDDATLLERHAAAEVKYSRQQATPLWKFEDLGTRRLDDTPFTMKVWRLSDTHGQVSQYFATSIVDDEVVSMSAILTNARSQEPRFRTVLAAYSGSFRALKPCVPPVAAD